MDKTHIMNVYYKRTKDKNIDLLMWHSDRGSDKRDVKTDLQKDIIMQTYSARQTDILKGNQAEKDKVRKKKKRKREETSRVRGWQVAAHL